MFFGSAKKKGRTLRLSAVSQSIIWNPDERIHPMNWKFWKRSSDRTGGTGGKTPRASRPKDLPEAVGRKMVVNMKLDPDMVWALKYVSRPKEGSEKVREFRIFDPNKALSTGLSVKDWSSLDERSELILYSGYYDKGTASIDIRQGG
jgi:hypothetical protein